MKKLVIHNEKITSEDVDTLVKICPFGAMESAEGTVTINESCKMCLICVKKGPKGRIELVVEEDKNALDKSAWNGVAVYVEHVDGEIHPITYELIGKAKELAVVIDQPVWAVMIGHNIREASKELLHYGVDKVFLYEGTQLAHFRIEPYVAAFEDFIKKNKPGSILVGATPVGRQLAPRVATRCRTGLTADCTMLNMNPNTDLDQIRPAFGGNIMAQIQTLHTRPQMSTVRYKVMNAPKRMEKPIGEIEVRSLSESALKCSMEVLKIVPKAKEDSIETAEVIVAVGRGLKKPDDLKVFEELADALGGKLASTRPLAESGWVNAKQQIGLSGRTVRPKLIIACGISGAIQFVAGMNKADRIIAINSDPNAPIFKVAHTGLVGDMYEVVPKLVEQIKKEKEVCHEF